MKTAWTTAEGSHVHRIGLARCTCFVVRTADGRTMLADTATAGERRALERQLDRLGVRALDAILLTHAHGDHAGNAAAWQRRFGCPVYAPRAELPWLEAGRCAMPKGTTRRGRAVMAVQRRLHIGERFEPVAGALPLPLPDRRARPAAPLGPHVSVVATPGHTRGSTSFVVDDEVALVGDAMIHLGSSLFPPFADLPEEIGPSWQALLDTGASTFLCAHGAPVSRALLDRRARELRRRSGWTY